MFLSISEIEEFALLNSVRRGESGESGEGGESGENEMESPCNGEGVSFLSRIEGSDSLLWISSAWITIYFTESSIIFNSFSLLFVFGFFFRDFACFSQFFRFSQFLRIGNTHSSMRFKYLSHPFAWALHRELLVVPENHLKWSLYSTWIFALIFAIFPKPLRIFWTSLINSSISFIL